MTQVLTPPKPLDSSSRVSSSGKVAQTQNSTGRVIDAWVLLSVRYDPYQQAAEAKFYATHADESLTIVKVRAVLKKRVQRMQSWQRN